MNDRQSTRHHNVGFLKSIGCRKLGNTTVFSKGNKFILSPAVSEAENGRFWFDVREVNLNRMNNEGFLVVRIVPDLFIVENLKNISSLLTGKLMDNRPNSGNVWGMHIKMNKSSMKAILYNLKDLDNGVPTVLYDKNEIENELRNRGL